MKCLFCLSRKLYSYQSAFYVSRDGYTSMESPEYGEHFSTNQKLIRRSAVKILPFFITVWKRNIISTFADEEINIKIEDQWIWTTITVI